MSFDDELRARMKDAANAAGHGADPAAASAYVAANAARAATQGAVTLKLIGGLGAVGLVAGAVLGATVLRAPADDAAAAAAGPAIEVRHGSTYDCPDGALVGELRSGDRVYVIARDESDTWSAVRDPRALSTVVWIPSAALEPDGERAEVPVMTCAEAGVSLGEVPTTTTAPVESTTTSTTVPGSSTTVAASTTTAASVVTTVPPTTVPPPITAPDTQQPTLQVQITSPAGNPPQIFDTSWPECVNDAQLVAFANDNRGVVAVTGTYAGLPGGPLNFTFSAGAWRATFGPFSGLTSGFYQDTSITVRARDAAGNLSNPIVVHVEVFETCVP